jgi:hypothetical protein
MKDIVRRLLINVCIGEQINNNIILVSSGSHVFLASSDKHRDKVINTEQQLWQKLLLLHHQW